LSPASLGRLPAFHEAVSKRCKQLSARSSVYLQPVCCLPLRGFCHCQSGLAQTAIKEPSSVSEGYKTAVPKPRKSQSHANTQRTPFDRCLPDEMYHTSAASSPVHASVSGRVSFVCGLSQPANQCHSPHPWRVQLIDSSCYTMCDLFPTTWDSVTYVRCFLNRTQSNVSCPLNNEHHNPFVRKRV
jgi:ribosomal protein L32